MRIGFGEFRLDTETRRLERRRVPVHLTPKAFLLLHTLLERRPKAIRKEELCDLLWPDVIVDQSSLATLALEIRRTLETAGGDPGVIRTVRRFGYAFDGHAFPFDAGGQDEGEAPQPILRCAGEIIPLINGANLLGRSRRSVVRIESPDVSRRHAQIVVTSGEAILEDLGSRRGTFVGATRVAGPVTLHAGEIIRLGSEAIGVFDVLEPPDSTVTESAALNRKPPTRRERESGP